MWFVRRWHLCSFPFGVFGPLRIFIWLSFFILLIFSLFRTHFSCYASILLLHSHTHRILRSERTSFIINKMLIFFSSLLRFPFCHQIFWQPKCTRATHTHTYTRKIIHQFIYSVYCVLFRATVILWWMKFSLTSKWNFRRAHRMADPSELLFFFFVWYCDLFIHRMFWVWFLYFTCLIVIGSDAICLYASHTHVFRVWVHRIFPRNIFNSFSCPL